MSEKNPLLIKDEHESISTRFVSFKGTFNRYDLAVMSSDRFAPDKVILNMNGNKYIRLNSDTLEENGYLEHKLHLTEIVADELRTFLRDIISSD